MPARRVATVCLQAESQLYVCQQVPDTRRQRGNPSTHLFLPLCLCQLQSQKVPLTTGATAHGQGVGSRSTHHVGARQRLRELGGQEPVNNCRSALLRNGYRHG